SMPPIEPRRPLSLYIHLPWCVRKCPYCDFNSYRANGAVPEAAYVDALLRDLDAESELAAGRPIHSIFIGGGTPSLFSGEAVARLSIGVQSFREAQLRALGRVHDERAAADAVLAAREAGFENLNVDLMYGRPDDTVSGAVADVERVIELGPAHVSWYQLTLEPSTAFHRRPPPLPDEDVVLDIEARGRALLAAAGYERYEDRKSTRLNSSHVKI